MKRTRLKRIVFSALAAFLMVGLAAAVFVAVSVKRALWAEPSIEVCLGRPLPHGAKVVAEDGYVRLFNGDRWFVVEMTEPQFHEFCSTVGLAHRDDLLTYWSTAFRPPDSIPWIKDVVNDQNTVYGEVNGALDAARWENGRMYLHHSVS